MIRKIGLKRFMTCLLLLCMMFAALPMSAFATDSEELIDESISSEEIIVSETDVQDDNSPSYYEQLLACTDAESMYTLLTNNAELAAALTAEEIAVLTALAESFPEDEDAVTYRADVLSILSVPVETDAEETLKSTPDAQDSGASLSVDVYDAPQEEGGTLITSFTSSGTADMGEWSHNDTRHIIINLNDIPADKNYELVLEMQPIIKVTNLPEVINGIESYTFTPNTMPVNIGGTFTAENYSGDIVFKINKGTLVVGFPLELGYDITLWNKMQGELNYTPDTPLISVYIREAGSDVRENQVNLHYAQAPVAWLGESIYLIKNGATADTTVHKTEAIKVGITRMVTSNYNHGFYYPKINFTLTYPSYTDANGNTYYLACDESSVIFSQTGGTADAEIVKDPENHTISITLKNYYSKSNKQFDNLVFSMPTSVRDALPSGTYVFKGTTVITLYRSTDATEGERLKANSADSYEITYITSDDYSIIKDSSTGNISMYNTVENGVVHHLGTFCLENEGVSDSPAYRIHMDFDTANTGAILVTSARLYGDASSELEYITVKYSMVDSSGNLVVEDATIDIENIFCGSTGSMDNKSYLFSRSLLPDEHSQYFFKSIEYVLTTIPAKTKFYYDQNRKHPDGAGTYWGYSNGTSGEIATTKITVSMIDEGSQTEIVQKNLTTSIKTTVRAPSLSSYMLRTASVDKSSVQAGDTVTVSGRFEITDYPYSYSNAAIKVRLALFLPQGIEFTEDDFIATTTGSKKTATEITVQKPTSDNPLWIVEFSSPDVKVGYYAEPANTSSNSSKWTYTLPDGSGWNFSITLHTNARMAGQTIQLGNAMWAVCMGQNGKWMSNLASGGKKSYKITESDVSNVVGVSVDLNEYTSSDSSNDAVACFSPKESTQFIIKAAPAILDIVASVRGSLENTGDLDAALEHFADYVTYDLKIACTDGGSSKDFYYLIPIPRVDSPINSLFVSMGRVNMNLKNEPFITHSGGVGFKLLYTTVPAKDLSYDYASTPGNVEWLEADAITDWTKVTMIKVIALSDIIETGTLSVISLPLVYAGNNYEYEYDATTYAQDAGKTVQFSSRGYYNHERGSQVFAGSKSSDLVTVRLEYTVPETQKITLIAAKDRDTNNGAVIKGEFTIDTQFLLDQNYGVRMVNPSNVTLVPSNSDFTKLNSNTNFGIKVSLNNGTGKDIDESASVDSPIELGTVASQGTAHFTFELFNGNALSDTTTPRTVRLDIIGHNGVTIPVEVTIKVIAAPVDNATVSIIDYNEYLPFSGSTSVSISQGSALTAQFVANELVPANYPTRELSFNTAPSEGTTILMIDWTVKTTPMYYYFKLDGNTSSISLTRFTNLATGNSYVNPSGTEPIAAETLLFVVDFANTTESSSMITLTRPGNNVDDVSQSLSYSVSGTRQFGLTVPEGNVEVEDEFVISYSNIAPNSADNHYNNRKMSLVISASAGYTLPVDAKITIGDEVYTQNAHGQFIIPLGSLSSSGTGTGSQKMVLQSETLTSNCTLNAELYVSATSNDSDPFAGERVSAQSFTVTPQTLPSFKVLDMSDRMFISGEEVFAAEVSYDHDGIDNCTVYLEVQRKSGTGYATDAFYLSTLNGVQATNTKINITDIVKENGVLSLIFKNDLANDTYRLLFTVVKNNEEVLTIPYNFMVVSD